MPNLRKIKFVLDFSESLGHLCAEITPYRLVNAV